MTMQITMLQTRMGEAGSLLLSGSTYTVSETFGAAMVGARFATDTANQLQPSTSSLDSAQAASVDALLVGDANFPGGVSVLKAFTGRSQLTGGVAATKVALMEVTIPDGWLSRLDVRMDIEASFNYTNNANTKEWGIAIGASSATGGTVATSVDLRTLSATTTASIADKIVVQRSAETPTRLYLVLPNNSRIFGVNATAGATVGVLASASIDPTATGRSLWVWGRIANTADQVSLEHLFVQLQRGAA